MTNEKYRLSLAKLFSAFLGFNFDELVPKAPRKKQFYKKILPLFNQNRGKKFCHKLGNYFLSILTYFLVLHVQGLFDNLKQLFSKCSLYYISASKSVIRRLQKSFGQWEILRIFLEFHFNILERSIFLIKIKTAIVFQSIFRAASEKYQPCNTQKEQIVVKKFHFWILHTTIS